MVEKLGVSFANNIPLIVTLVVLGVLVLVGIVAFILFLPKIKQKHKEKAEKKAEERAKFLQEDTKNKAFDDNIFAKRDAENAKPREFKPADESESVVSVLQGKSNETDIKQQDLLNLRKGATLGSEKERDDVLSVLQGKQYEGGKVDVSDKKIDAGQKESADFILSVMNAPENTKTDAVNNNTENKNENGGK